VQQRERGRFGTGRVASSASAVRVVADDGSTTHRPRRAGVDAITRDACSPEPSGVCVVALCDTRGMDAAGRSDRTRAIFHDAHAIIDDDHFVYVSGDHGRGWIAKDLVYPDPERCRELGALLAEVVAPLEPDVLCGPATGGLFVSTWTGFHLPGVTCVFAEHDPAWRRGAHAHPGDPMRGPFVLTRGYDDKVAGRRVVVVDDIVNTGHSIRQSVDVVRACGGDVVAAACWIDRGNVGSDEVHAPVYVNLHVEKIPFWPAVRCPQCADGVPVNTRFAHGREWVELHGQPGSH
jgi:orotate phosphoribosyltransferase